ncbi:hypothetical protein [Spiroplasma endosymbiont of Megaselia nigra]|uniref:hypothetical protein n=1 Tax=Spiroplasma endosymbiont of Megaselia nigra TaxID=2478537 RepID=UPI000F865F2D|nr:hypothetical protein [Spiroplasma endosymbiont of Megaselia nigra]RUO86143.1 hypothetical protein D9R21_04825 [Spiroplasma endosymbiont of Megaselia nigra]
MKKLLSLLSVLTIIGAAVPTTIAASPYQKEENLNRNKRDISKINNLINEIKNIKFNGILKVLYYGPALNGETLRAQDMFTWGNRLYFRYQNSGWIYEYDQQRKTVVRAELNHKVYEYLNFVNWSNVIKNNKNIIKLNNKEYFIKSSDLYEKDKNNNTEQKITNDNMIMENGIILNDKIYLLSDNNKLYEYWPFESMLEQDDSLISWKQLFNDWKNNMDFDFKKNFTSKSENEKKSWIDNKKHELLVKIDNFKDKINIIKNRESIEQLKIQFSSLEQKIDNLKIKIYNLLNNSSNLLTMCGNLTSLLSAGTSVIPVFGSITSAAFGIISAGCSIANT